jgi:polar amino acid transport system ATP-binding protein
MLSIKNVSKTHHKKIILDNICLDINSGEIVALIGESGVGKSTLLRIIANLEKADQGTFMLHGTPTSPHQLHKEKQVGMVFQHFNLFEHMTVLANVSFALEKVQKKSVHDAQRIATHLLAQYGLSDKTTAYPSALSGGQKQRLAIARALALNPDIMCFDEPTSALDPHLTTVVAHAINKISAQGTIVLLATHDSTLIARLNATLCLMQHGKITEKTTTKILQKNPHAYPEIQKFLIG